MTDRKSPIIEYGESKPVLVSPKPPEVLDERVQLILQWLNKNAPLLRLTNSVKILLHIKNIDVRGEITHFPES